MLKVFEWQLDAMDTAYLERTTRDLVDIVQEALPEATAAYDDEALHRLVTRGREAAERYGMSRGCDVERYLYLMLSLGEDFDTEVDWASETFTRDDYTGQVRMDVAWSIFEGRDEAPAGVLYLPEPSFGRA